VYLEKQKKDRVGGYSSVLEHLPSMQKALGSIPRTIIITTLIQLKSKLERKIQICMQPGVLGH
jgi:hypothetical protein